MSKKIDDYMDTMVIRYKGIFNFDGLYKEMRAWFDNHRYDFMETLYKDKVSSPFGNELEIKMDPELKVTEYVKFHMHIEIKIWDNKEFEAEIDGVKKKVIDGRITLWLKGSVELDYTNKFKKHEWIHNFMVDKVLPRYFEFKYYDKMYADVLSLHDHIKRFLKIDA